MAYFPNGIAGAVLDDQCSDCRLGDGPCPVYFVQGHFNYSQIGRKKLRKCLNLLVDKNGKCLMKPLLDDLPGYGRRESDG